ncbi:MAG: tail fiber protein [Bergeyella sp.]
MRDIFNYVGEIKLYSGNRIPEGWLPCDGRALLINEYKALAQLLGNKYGGTDTTFCLPDLRSRIPLGQSTVYAQASKGGTETVTLTTDNIPAHNHTPLCSSASKADSKDAANAFWASTGEKGRRYSTAEGNLHLNEESILPEGEGMPHENRMPVLALSYIIATNGTHPVKP